MDVTALIFRIDRHAGLVHSQNGLLFRGHIRGQIVQKRSQPLPNC